MLRRGGTARLAGPAPHQHALARVGPVHPPDLDGRIALLVGVLARLGATLSLFGVAFQGIADWQLARWLDSDGLIVVPWRNPNESGVAVFPCPNGEDPGRDIEAGLRKSVTAAATARISERRTDEQTRRAQGRT